MKRLELLVTNGELIGRRFAVAEGGVRLGRSSSNDIHATDEQLSRNHCLFEPFGAAGIRVTDLASANGTLVNGRMIGSDPVELKPNDLVEVGSILIRVVGDESPSGDAGSVDLGLSANQPSGAQSGAGETQGRRRSPLANVLWAVAVLAVGVAIYLLLTSPEESAQAVSPVKTAESRLVEVEYEKVEANLDGIYRYRLAVTPDGAMEIVLDDTRENRHPKIPSRKLGESARAELAAILSEKALADLQPEYVGVDPEPPALNSWALRVVFSDRVRRIKVVNASEPEPFRALRENLEAFGNNELGVHALQYPREKLIALAEESIALGQSKWADREVQYGNLFGAIAAFQQAIFYLETIDPKPACIQTARSGFDEATRELDRRFSEQRFVAERALKLESWDEAQRALSVLLEMVPERTDARHREAAAKLIDVEKRIKGGR